MKKRSIATYVILSIITCDIYRIVVNYKQMTELEIEGANLKLPAWAVLLLNLFVTPAGGALFGFACDDALNQIREKRGLKKEDNLVLLIIFGILLPVVSGALVQDAVNKIIDGQGTPKDPDPAE
jgi:hypothetical protein